MQAYKWFEESEEFKLKSDVIFKGLTYSNLVENIPRDLIKKLYADDNGRFIYEYYIYENPDGIKIDSD